MTVYYNENDPALAEWLDNLINAGHIAPGVIDTRSILDVRPVDLDGFTQCHFFAGIGIWSYALREAGWPDDRPVWTGSCPCQPFSAAGKGKGFADERHLWPAWLHLIRLCKPVKVLGEQVASQDGLAWLDLVQSDMEAEGFAFGAKDICAAGFGAPHIRQRLYFVADTYDAERRAEESARYVGNWPPPRWAKGYCDATPRREDDAGLLRGHWRDHMWGVRSDGARLGLEPGTCPVAHVNSGTMVKLRAYGNALVAEEAVEFIRAYDQGAIDLGKLLRKLDDNPFEAV